MERALAFFGKAEANLTATEALTAANARIVTLEAEAATHATQLGNQAAQIATLTAEVAAKDSEITTLKADLATAKGTANAVIASQGLAAESLPPLDPRSDKTDPKTLTLTERCQAAAKTNGSARN